MKHYGSLFLLGALLFLSFQNSILAQHTNVLVGAEFAPNEPSICINPKNTLELVAATNLNNVYYSHDGGASWTRTPVTCPWGIWGDPVIGVDTAGAFYYLHLSNPPSGNWIDRIIAQKSTDGGLTWSPGSYMGLNGAKAQDKHWIAVDRRSNALYVTWTQFDDYGSSSPADSSVILFSKSTDAGGSWSPPRRLSQLAGDCIDDDNTAEGAVPCVGPNGEIYVAWSNRGKIWFDRSPDGGETWLDEDLLIAEHAGGWNHYIPGIYRANGFPVTACDLSGGPNHGALYVNWADQRNGESDTDIWLAKSTDGGNTWSEARRVNDDGPGKHQFFTWMAIDQATGWLWFVFYDRRHYSDNHTDVYMAVSQDGGETFTNFIVSESPFLPTENYFFGDYTNVAAHDNVVRPIWARLESNNLSIWSALVQPGLISATRPEPVQATFSMEDPYPNPFSTETGISFKLHRPSLIRLSVLGLQGRELARPIDDEWRDYGKYLERIDMQALGLQPGLYFLLLSVDGVVEMKKIVQAK